MKQKIIIDTDSGMDDIIAIAMIVSSGKFDIVGVTTVRGLVTPLIGKKNLTKIFKFLNYNVKIVSGCCSPLNKNRINYSFPKQDIINSSKLLCLNNLLKAVKVKKQIYPARDFIFNKINTNGGKITLLCLGPLTNIAGVIQKYGQRFTQNINQIIIMGGAVFTRGNVPSSRTAEYNIYLDPEAAEVVFSSRIPIKLTSLDATKFVPASNELKNKIEKFRTNNKCGQIIKRVILANKNDFDYFYDPLAAGILIDPKIILQIKRTGIKVSKNKSNVGLTLPFSNPNIIEVVTKVDTKKFINLLFRTIK